MAICICGEMTMRGFVPNQLPAKYVKEIIPARFARGHDGNEIG
jgi:hypothetical protein